MRGFPGGVGTGCAPSPSAARPRAAPPGHAGPLRRPDAAQLRSKARCSRCLSIAQGHLVLQELGVIAVCPGRTPFVDSIATIRAL